MKGSLVDPGVVHRNSDWLKSKVTGLPCEEDVLAKLAMDDPPTILYLKLSETEEETRIAYCSSCAIFRPPGTNHCQFCQHCVVGLDHHCNWMGNCISQKNMSTFNWFQRFACLYSTYLAACSAYFVTMELSKYTPNQSLQSWVSTYPGLAWSLLISLLALITSCFCFCRTMMVYVFRFLFVLLLLVLLSVSFSITVTGPSGPGIAAIVIMYIMLPVSLNMTAVQFFYCYEWFKKGCK